MLLPLLWAARAQAPPFFYRHISNPFAVASPLQPDLSTLKVSGVFPLRCRSPHFRPSLFCGVTAKFMNLCCPTPTTTACEKPRADSHSGGFLERISVTEDCGFLLPPGPSYPLSCERQLGDERSEKRKSTLGWRV